MLAGGPRPAQGRARLNSAFTPAPLTLRSPAQNSTQKLGWVDPRVQMIFQVVGEDTGREAMVRGAPPAPAFYRARIPRRRALTTPPQFPFSALAPNNRPRWRQ